MRILKIFLVILLLLVGVFFIGGFFIPANWSVSQSTVIEAKPKRIYPYIASFKEWHKWSPWNATKDPSLKFTYEGPISGLGAKQSWTSEDMGKGRMQLTKADPKSGVAYNLFIDMGSSQSTLLGRIDLKPSDKKGATEVVWTDEGNSGDNYMHRWMSLVLKTMLAKELKTGLSSLKSLVETKDQAPS